MERKLAQVLLLGYQRRVAHHVRVQPFCRSGWLRPGLPWRRGTGTPEARNFWACRSCRLFAGCGFPATRSSRSPRWCWWPSYSLAGERQSQRQRSLLMQSAFRRATEHGEIPAGPSQGTYEISLARGSTAALPPAAPGNAGHGAACGRPIRTLTQIGSTDKIVPRRMLLDSRLASFGHCGWKVVVMREAELGQRSHTRQCLTCKNKGCIGHCRFAKPIPTRSDASAGRAG